ncbi:Septin-domain-containing protein [Phycomyces blakesleeanus]|uniref:Septin-type G domain-containing protein n=2 Tax=Phycomyces blakesleeanus TaxID=4837 RepID=A0A162N7C8_PHYB8|nr:hypothetical protein PHYBLDRAFT_152539 [Phycomyces blakesleeanus NRRL 1555(-)]OAD66464.1 hypothetical protein PHYBLDRAFT_152539 [Phycomyces blakesleeanus NRRL 1555(-)]|eukprot:XP_018284504.1 hypothetical protein PHYBLDRAFT_152539 [Phycomyces blakesleeanus NRRL 1555(-)]
MPRKEKSSLNLMVVGAPGSGKTSFLNTLSSHLNTYGHGITKPSQTQSDHLFRTTQLQWQDNKNLISLTLVDTPGFTETVLGYQAHYTKKYLEHQFDRVWMEEVKLKRNTKVQDTRIHVCLYFIDASITDFSPMEILLLREIAAHVSVVPVLAKSDLLSPEELAEKKQFIRNLLFDTYQIPVYGSSHIDTVEEDIMDWCVPDLTTRKSTWRPLKSYVEWLDQQHNENDEMEEAGQLKDYLEQMPFSVTFPKSLECSISSEEPSPGIDYSETMDLIQLLLANRDSFRHKTNAYFYEKYRTQKIFDERTDQLMAVHSCD